MGQKLSKLSFSRRHRGVAVRSSAVDLPLPPPSKKEDASSSVGSTHSGRVISPHARPTPHSGHQPTCSGSLSAEKERSESALAPTAALSLSSLGSGGQVCGQMVHSKVNRPNLGHAQIWDTLNKILNHWAQKERIVALRMSNCPLVHAPYADVIGIIWLASPYHKSPLTILR